MKALSTQLLQEKVHTTGTLRANRAGNPEVISKKMKKGKHVCQYTNKGICVSKWGGKLEVLTIFTKFAGELIVASLRREVQKRKPCLVTEYK